MTTAACLWRINLQWILCQKQIEEKKKQELLLLKQKLLMFLYMSDKDPLINKDRNNTNNVSKIETIINFKTHLRCCFIRNYSYKLRLNQKLNDKKYHWLSKVTFFIISANFFPLVNKKHRTIKSSISKPFP